MQNNGFRGAVRARASGVVFVVSFFFAMGSALLCAPSYAQIVAHPGALAAHLPQITAARNGVPLVNIAAPSAGGVSRNQFSQFDVDKSGVVLNNGTGNNLTRIGGWVPGNPQLGARSARVIVGEVLSTKRSVLQGYRCAGDQEPQRRVCDQADRHRGGCVREVHRDRRAVVA